MSRARMMIRLLLAVALLSLTACPAPSTFHTATPIKAGKMDLGVAVHVLGAADARTGTGGGFPNFEAQFRYGVAKWFDFGIKVYPVGAMVDFNFCVLNVDSFALSIDPTFSGMGIFGGSGSISGGAFLGYLYLPVLLDVVKTDVVTLTVGPKPMLAVGSVSSISSGTSGSAVFYMGGMVGVKFQFNDTFSLIPEGNFFYDPQFSTILWDGGISFNFTF